MSDAATPSAPPAFRLSLRRMRRADVPAVAAIEDAAFSPGWPRTAFLRELEQNKVARYIVLTREPVAKPGAAAEMIGFAGCWLLLDEAHVVTVAVAPEHRRNGFGRLLVHGLIDLARREGMAVATLECRVSNTPARALYRDYGFYEVGTRRHYYADNQEDAVIMTTEEFGSAPYRERYARLQQRLALELPGVDPCLTD